LFPGWTVPPVAPSGLRSWTIRILDCIQGIEPQVAIQTIARTVVDNLTRAFIELPKADQIVANRADQAAWPASWSRKGCSNR